MRRADRRSVAQPQQRRPRAVAKPVVRTSRSSLGERRRAESHGRSVLLKSQKGAKKKDSSSDDSSSSDSDQEELRRYGWSHLRPPESGGAEEQENSLLLKSQVIQYEYHEGQADQLVTMTSIQGLASARAELGLLSQKWQQRVNVQASL